MPQSATKNLILTVILLMAAAGMVWSWTRQGEDRRPPSTEESKTVWVCEKCGHTGELTALQLSDARQKARLVQDSASKGLHTSTRETLLLCPKCNEKAMACGVKCTQCGKGLLDSDSNLCAECAKAAKSKAPTRKIP